MKRFVNDVSSEMKKVSWPNQEQLKESTIVVVAVTAIITIIVLVIDTGLSWTLTKIF
ncbi:MAG: preprotein translocase subunit SecE [Candidatus Kapabacteria bacterium]|nr:preprotein translocase subunit SecE [Candidatus Kapabacteria bacterium]